MASLDERPIDALPTKRHHTGRTAIGQLLPMHVSTAFSPDTALLGGALIGFAAALLMFLTGRIAGISGILGGSLIPVHRDFGWRLAFIAGLIAAPIAARWAGMTIEAPAMPGSWLVILIAGFLVGFGTRLGGGCTSGHGVCGLARLSSRSIVATTIFFVTAIIVVAIMRHLIGSSA